MFLGNANQTRRRGIYAPGTANYNHSAANRSVCGPSRRLRRVPLGPLACFFAMAVAMHASNPLGMAVDGVCRAGTSCPAVPLPYNASGTLSETLTHTLSNGDKYLINGSWTAENNSNGSNLGFEAIYQVTYEGNAAGGASAADTITVDWYSAFQTPYSLIGLKLYFDGAFSHNVSPSNSVAECINGPGSCAGPVMPPGSFYQTPYYSQNSSNGVWSVDATYTFNFGANSPVGSYIVIGQTTALHSPKIGSFSPESGQTGSSVTIMGTNLSGATGVTFHGSPASFTANSETEITATVPCGTATGPIQVTTPGGLATSKTDFTVTSGKCWNAVSDFSITSNPHGVWGYGWATSVGGMFTSLATPQDPCLGLTGLICWWNGISSVPNGAQIIRNTTQEPIDYLTIVAPQDMLWLAVESNEVIVRWTAPATGIYLISGSFTGIDTHGASVNVGIYQDVAAALAQGNISAYRQTYAFNLPGVHLAAGTTIDFTGVYTDTGDYDSVGLIATIYEVGP
jgi:hypothetical protein